MFLSFSASEAQLVFAYTKRDQYEVVMEFTNSREVDLIFDQWVGEKLYPELKLLADFGMIIVYNGMEGAPKEPLEINRTRKHYCSRACYTSPSRARTYNPAVNSRVLYH